MVSQRYVSYSAHKQPTSSIYDSFKIKFANLKQADTGLPSGWEVRHSNSKNLPYYFNPSQQLSRWEPPPGTDTDKLKKYMAEHHSAPDIIPVAGDHLGPDNNDKIRVVHLLVKHKDSRRPSSWREVGSSRLVIHGGSQIDQITGGDQEDKGRGYVDYTRTRKSHSKRPSDIGQLSCQRIRLP